MALDMHAEFAELARKWSKRGYGLDMGIGVAQGYATLGAIGFEGRLDYGAIGGVCSLAARLCAHAKGGQTLVSQRIMSAVEHLVTAEPVGELTLKGFHRALPAFDVRGLTPAR
jgi:class 3 adenylate cyclase